DIGAHVDVGSCQNIHAPPVLCRPCQRRAQTICIDQRADGDSGTQRCQRYVATAESRDSFQNLDLGVGLEGYVPTKTGGCARSEDVAIYEDSGTGAILENRGLEASGSANDSALVDENWSTDNLRLGARDGH